MKLFKGRHQMRYTMESIARAIVLAKHMADLGPAPAASDDYVSAVLAQAAKMPGYDSSFPWGMFSNDQYGDCVFADSAHAVMHRTANTGTMLVPTADQTLFLYAANTGYAGDPNDKNAVVAWVQGHDNGANELSVMQYLENTGWLNNKLSGFANLDVTNPNQEKWAIQIFGSSRWGVNLPNGAQQQFENGQPWNPIPGDTLDGGHDVLAVKYDADGTIWVVTWGRLQAVTPAWQTAKYDDGTPYIEEKHAELDTQWLKASGQTPSGFAWQQCVSDLTAIVSNTPAPQPVPPSPTKLSKQELDYLVRARADADTRRPNMTVIDMGNDLVATIKQILAA